MPKRRRRNQGSVFYSASERTWIARVSVGISDGRRVQHKARARTRELADKELERLQSRYGRAAEVASMTLDTYLGHWLETVEPTVRPSTFRSYGGRVKHITRLLGGIPVGKLTPSDIRRLIRDRLASGLSPQTVAHIVIALGTALEGPRRERQIPDNPARLVRLPRIEREPVRATTPEMAQAIRRAVAGAHLEAFYVLLLGSGMRAGEAAGLDWRDVDLDASVVTVRHGKTARSVRMVPIPGFVVASLREHGRRTKLTGPVFTGERTGERISVQSASGIFRRLLVRAKLPHMRVHDLRHANATLMLATGAPMRLIADQLGHADSATTSRIYAHIVPATHRRAMEALDEAIGDGQGAGSSAEIDRIPFDVTGGRSR